MDDEVDALRKEVAELREKLAALQKCTPCRGVRKRSAETLFGLPLYDIAFGPDPEKGEMRGHARGIIAIGDIATGWLAIGCVARRIVALGGLALGAISIGGCSIGLLLSLGGLAIGGLAVGGAAVGYVAVGGAAVGYYACGGDAWGKHVIDATQRSPEAIQFFKSIPWLPLPRIAG